MALTPRRWCAALGVILLALLAVFIPPRRDIRIIAYLPWSPWYGGWSRSPAPDSLWQLKDRTSGAAKRAGEALVLAMWRDSVLRQTALIQRARSGGPQILATVPVEPAMRARIQAALDSAWRTLPRREERAWTVLVLGPSSDTVRVAGSSAHRAGLWMGNDQGPVLQGAAVVGDGCVLLADARILTVPVAPRVLLDQLAPCRWRAAFGAPGPQISAWLDRQEWSVVYPLRWWLRDNWTELSVIAGRRGTVLTDTGTWTGGAQIAIDRALAWGGEISAAACYRGDQESCLRIMLDPRNRSSESQTEVGGFAVNRGNRNLPGASLLAGMLTAVLDSVGPDRFQEFWTSKASPDSALSQALQQPVAPWLAARVEHRLGRPRVGPVVRPTVMVVSLLLAGVFAGAGLVTTSRRRLN